MIRFFLISAAALLPFSVRAETAAEFLARVEALNPPPVKFALSVKTPDGTLNYTAAVKDKKWRLDGHINGQDSSILYDGKNVVILMMGMAMKQSGAEKMIDLPDGDGFELGDETTVAGQPCRLLVKQGEKVCVHERYALPIYAETNGSVITMENIRETSVPDSEFRLPPGVPVLDMSDALRFGG